MTEAELSGIAIMLTNAWRRDLCDRQSQAHSTRLAPFGTRFKEVLRLNCDQICLRQLDRFTDEPMEEDKASVTEFKDCCCQSDG